MKFIGHAWVAVKAVPRGNKKLLMLGSILPEIMFYTKDHPFEFEEIHEGGDKVYLYLKEKKPDYADLGLGMLTHSEKSGADKFNQDENLAILGYEGVKLIEIRNKLSDVLGVTYNTAKARAHSILELAVELRIIRENLSFVQAFNEVVADKVIREKSKRILADCFDKSYKKVAISLDELLNKAKPDYFKDADGLANLWAELTKEFDPEPDKKRLAKLLQDLYRGYKGKDEVFLRKCVNWTRSNLESRF